MATLVLAAAGAWAGSALGLGVVGAIAGRAIGAIAGSFIDAALFGGGTQRQKGPRLSDLRVTESAEGAPILRVYGTARLGGQIIWATRLIEEKHTHRSGGGKGGGPKVETTTYSYYANFAIALCEGPISDVTRIWADGKPMDLTDVTWRLHRGTETQTADPLIAATQGVDATPAYRGVAYVVFERLPLKDYGNRIPQLTFEVVRPVDDVIASHLTAVNVIPGSGEFFCDPRKVTSWRRPLTSGGGGGDDDAGAAPLAGGQLAGGDDDDDTGDGWSHLLADRRARYVGAENVHMDGEATDWTVSMDQLQRQAPALQAAALVVSWFGDDLRCGHCRIRPGVETRDKVTRPYAWRVDGVARSAAYLVSRRGGRAAYGGTPADVAVVRAIRDLKARGIAPVFYPFVLMDVPAGNDLPNPWGGASQPPYPWRGRITCHPAPGRAGSPDASAAVRAQIDAFLGTAAPSDFSIVGDEVRYSGDPNDWGYRRFILHHAWLCRAAGGVHAFLVGSELRGLTALRDAPGSYPFVAALRALAADVKGILGPDVKVSYAADWSEWSGHQAPEAPGAFVFHLDPLWADPHVDFIGIDNYMPLADWRDGGAHLDAAAGWRSIYDVDYLKANIAGGEGYDWYYASKADRDAQRRTPITDAAHGEPWIWRRKDLKNWWINRHHDRVDGTRSASPTAWVPRSKPIWFTELGCPAVDKGPNQPNVFYDPKSSESALPYYSDGVRDDAVQRQFLAAHFEYWNTPGQHNPLSTSYQGRMVDARRLFVWAWDARPWPAWPTMSDVWGDADNHELGHWLNGRLGQAPLTALVARLIREGGLEEATVEELGHMVTGLVVDGPRATRQVLEPLMRAFAFDAAVSGDVLRVFPRRAAAVAEIAAADLVEITDGGGGGDGIGGDGAPLFEIVREEETALPAAVRLHYFEEGADHRAAVAEAEARLPSVGSRRESDVTVPVSMRQQQATARAQVMLAEARAGRETLRLRLAPEWIGLEPGDVLRVTLPGDDPPRLWRIEEITDDFAREVSLRACDPDALRPARTPPRRRRGSFLRPPAPPTPLLLDLPPLRADDAATTAWLAVHARPWPGPVAVMRNTGAGWRRVATVTAPAVIGELLDPLPAGPQWRFDHASSCRVQLWSGTLAAVGERGVLDGGGAAAIGSPETGWEIVQFAAADLVATATWRIATLLRGQRGSAPEMPAAGHPAGSLFVLLDEALEPLRLSADIIDTDLVLRFGPQGRPMTDDSWSEHTFRWRGIAARPFRPVHVTARRLAGGDIVFAWLRRTRTGGDAWGAAEPPVGEAFERYRLEILDAAGAAARTITVTTPAATWTAAQQAADFPGGLPDVVSVRVAQVSEIFGPGAATTATLAVPA